MLTPSFDRELSRQRADFLRAEAAGARRSRRARRHRRYVRNAVGVRMVSVGLHLLGGEEVR